MSTRVTWVRQAPGWYTSERDKIVRREIGANVGWLLYPYGTPPTYGPYRTLAEAKRAAEE